MSANAFTAFKCKIKFVAKEKGLIQLDSKMGYLHAEWQRAIGLYANLLAGVWSRDSTGNAVDACYDPKPPFDAGNTSSSDSQNMHLTLLTWQRYLSGSDRSPRKDKRKPRKDHLVSSFVIYCRSEVC
ncbi:hypothetical protein AC624_06925 [Bacillus sp. FJAT-27238]|nr:hypothetical protein AC624_06925 [Bacillus sp. FJAT-27238]